eukprot:2404599-Ditylum_brightwellii.AAC.1
MEAKYIALLHAMRELLPIYRSTACVWPIASALQKADILTKTLGNIVFVTKCKLLLDTLPLLERECQRDTVLNVKDEANWKYIKKGEKN